MNSDSGFEPHRGGALEAGFKAAEASLVRNGAGTLIAVLST